MQPAATIGRVHSFVNLRPSGARVAIGRTSSHPDASSLPTNNARYRGCPSRNPRSLGDQLRRLGLALAGLRQHPGPHARLPDLASSRPARHAQPAQEPGAAIRRRRRLALPLDVATLADAAQEPVASGRADGGVAADVNHCYGARRLSLLRPPWAARAAWRGGSENMSAVRRPRPLSAATARRGAAARPSTGARGPSTRADGPCAGAKRPRAAANRPCAGAKRPCPRAQRPRPRAQRPRPRAQRPCPRARRPCPRARRPCAGARRPSPEAQWPRAAAAG